MNGPCGRPGGKPPVRQIGWFLGNNQMLAGRIRATDPGTPFTGDHTRTGRPPRGYLAAWTGEASGPP